MKAIDLIHELEKYPDFDVRIAIFEPRYDESYCIYNVVGIDDIGHSDKILQLDIDEKEGQ